MAGKYSINKEYDKELIVWIVVIVWTFSVTISRAIRMPNDFSEAHWLLDYRFGFIRRGLVGTICHLVANTIGIQMSPQFILVLSSIMLSCMSVAMLYLLFLMLRRQKSKDTLIVGLVFTSSPFVVMMAHLLGYFDAFLYFLAIVSVKLTISNHPFLAAIMSTLGMLIHEGYLLVGFPLVILASIVMLLARGTKTSYTLRSHIFALCIPFFVFLAIPLLQILTTDETSLRDQLAKHLKSFGFVPTRAEFVAIWQTTSFVEFFFQQVGLLDERLLDPIILASVAPTFLTILIFIHESYRIRAFSPFSIILVGTVCAPLAMHAVAWDTGRISTYLIGSGFIAWWILSETQKPQPTTHLFLLVAIPTLALNIFGRIPLMDGEVERFSNPIRLLLYGPAIVLLATLVVRNLREYGEVHAKGIKAINSDKE